MPKAWTPPATLDDTDLQILAALAANARTPMKDLAARIGLSSPSTADRVRRLEDIGAIAAYGIAIDPEVLGLPIGVYIRIRPLPGKLPGVVDLLAARPEIVSCDRITGEDCLIAKAVLPSVAYLEGLIDALLPIATTTTSLIQSSPIPARLPDFQALATRVSRNVHGPAKRQAGRA